MPAAIYDCCYICLLLYMPAAIYDCCYICLLLYSAGGASGGDATPRRFSARS